MDILDQIRGDIGGCTAPDVDVAAITAETTLESLGIDSLDRIELVMRIEERFEIEISHAEARECVSVGGIVKLIETKLAEVQGCDCDEHTVCENRRASS